MSRTRSDHPSRRTLVAALALSLGSLAVADAPAAPAWGAQRFQPLPAARGNAPSGANLTVTNCNDSGPGSLRQAMLDAHNNTRIEFAMACSTITLTSGALTDPNTDSLKIVAPIRAVAGRAQPSITIDAATHSRVIEHRSGGALELYGLALVNGRTSAIKGGCIYANGRVSLTGVTVSGCAALGTSSTAALGGGIWSDDEVDLVHSTVSGNVAQAGSGGYAYGGGVFTPYALYTQFSTISGNAATGFGYGGGASTLGRVAITSSLVSGNSAAYGAGLALFGGPDVGSGDLYLHDSTVTDNSASGFAGGIEVGADLSIYNSTIANNTGQTAAHANGVLVEGTHALTLVSTIIAGNALGDIGGASSISGHANLVGSSNAPLPPGTLGGAPQFGTFGNHGGQTDTLALLPGSPAIDAGDNPLGLLCDQRGGAFTPPDMLTGVYERRFGTQVDIGAFEYGAGDRLFASGFEVPSASGCVPP